MTVDRDVSQLRRFLSQDAFVTLDA
jgi:hypothetical protein